MWFSTPIGVEVIKLLLGAAFRIQQPDDREARQSRAPLSTFSYPRQWKRFFGDVMKCRGIALACLSCICASCAAPWVVVSADGVADSPLVRLHVFDCGELSFPDVSAFGLGNADTDVRRMFVPCYLIRHPRGDLLWDAGLDPAIVGQGAVNAGAFTMTYARSLVDQMDDMGLSPDDVEFMALSHMHFDHVGAATQFPKARLLIQAAEYEAAFLRPGDYGGVYDIQQYGGLAGNSRQLLTGDHDVFGDGTVMIISAPGHTPGHQVLLVHLRNAGPVLLSGDLYHFRATRRLRAVPTFNTNADQTLASMAKVERLIEETGAALWIEHDWALAQALRLAPAAHD